MRIDINVVYLYLFTAAPVLRLEIRWVGIFSQNIHHKIMLRWENNFELNWLNIVSDWSKQQLLQKNDITSDVTTQVIGEKTQVVEEYDAIMQWGNACPILLTTFEIVYSINQWRTDSMGSDIDRFIGLKIDFYTLVTCLVCVVIISCCRWR